MPVIKRKERKKKEKKIVFPFFFFFQKKPPDNGRDVPGTKLIPGEHANHHTLRTRFASQYSIYSIILHVYIHVIYIYIYSTLLKPFVLFYSFTTS